LRLTDSKIKEAIVHPETEVRLMAVEYFSKSFSPDPTVMPWVIQAIEKYGREKGYQLIGRRVELVQTDESLQWILNELSQKVRPQNENQVNYQFNLNRMLRQADSEILQHHQDIISATRGLNAETRKHIARTVEIRQWDAETCWRALEQFCEEGKSKQYVNEVDLGYAGLLTKRLARDKELVIDRVLSILSQEIEDFDDNPLKWMEPLCVQLAGEMTLQAAIPVIVGKLKIDADYLSEVCVEALVKIGTDEVIEAIYYSFAEAEWDFRLYATSVLENIHTDLAVQRCLDLLLKEEDLDIKTNLARAVLTQFAPEGIEAVRQVVLNEDWDGFVCDLRGDLVAAATLMEQPFPEYERFHVEVEQERMRRAQIRSERRALIVPSNRTFVRTEPKVGRNDPCPCGSGNKYKKCCLK
jgi:SEC-C motif